MLTTQYFKNLPTHTHPRSVASLPRFPTPPLKKKSWLGQWLAEGTIECGKMTICTKCSPYYCRPYMPAIDLRDQFRGGWVGGGLRFLDRFVFSPAMLALVAPKWSLSKYYSLFWLENSNLKMFRRGVLVVYPTPPPPPRPRLDTGAHRAGVFVDTTVGATLVRVDARP